MDILGSFKPYCFGKFRQSTIWAVVLSAGCCADRVIVGNTGYMYQVTHHVSAPYTQSFGENFAYDWPNERGIFFQSMQLITVSIQNLM